MNSNYKPVIKFSLIILLFYCSSLFILIPIYLFNINIKTCSDTTYTLLRLFPSIVLAIIMFLIYRKELKKEIIDFKNNFGKYSDIAIKYWSIGFILMLITNYIIVNLVPVSLGTNEKGVREIINTLPLISFFCISFISPFEEELIFRKNFKEVFKSKWTFVLISGITFGLLHVITSFNSLYELLYIISYSALGICFSLAYYKTNNIFSSIFIHTLHNSLLVLLNIFYTGVILL